MAMPSSLRSRIVPPVTPSKLANAGVFTLWRSEWRLSIARLWFTAGLYFLQAELVGGWPIAVVITIMMLATHTNEKYTPGYIAFRMQDLCVGRRNVAPVKKRLPFAEGRKKSRSYQPITIEEN
jgi:hypothetical protein